MVPQLRVGLEDYLVVRSHDVLRIHDRHHAERLLGDQGLVPTDELDMLLDRLAAGDVMLVRRERPRPLPCIPRVDHQPLATSPAPLPVPRPTTWLAIEVRHGSGVGYPRASFVLELPDGTERHEQLDDDSRWRADDVPAGGTCRIRFEPPLRLAPAQLRARPSDLTHRGHTTTLLHDAGATAARLATATQHLLVVPKTAAHAVRVGDIHFGTARAVVLPALPEGTPRGRVTPLEAIAAAIAHLATTEPRPLVLVAGHTDAVGSDGDNDVLSEARATNVSLLLRGDGASWSAHAQQHHDVADLQRVLQWVAARQGWPCDPGPIDGRLGPVTEGARRIFRERYNRELSGTLPLDAETSVADWEAVFELYTQELAVLLSDLGGPSRLWPIVRSRDLGIVACGERWPARTVELRGDDGDDDDRRVEVLFFDVDDLPDLTHPEPGYDVYGSQRYRIEPVPPRPRIRFVRLQLRDWQGVPLPDVEYELAEVEGAHVGTTDAHGFTQRFLATEGTRATIRVRELEYRVVVDERSPDEPVAVRSVLNALGLFAGRIAAHDRNGRAAIRNFQWLRGLPITGQLDPQTTTAIVAATTAQGS